MYNSTYDHSPQGIAESYKRFKNVEFTAPARSMDDVISAFKQDLLSKGVVVEDPVSFELAVHDYLHACIINDQIALISPEQYLFRGVSR